MQRICVASVFKQSRPCQWTHLNRENSLLSRKCVLSKQSGLVIAALLCQRAHSPVSSTSSQAFVLFAWGRLVLVPFRTRERLSQGQEVRVKRGGRTSLVLQSFKYEGFSFFSDFFPFLGSEDTCRNTTVKQTLVQTRRRSSSSGVSEQREHKHAAAAL